MLRPIAAEDRGYAFGLADDLRWKEAYGHAPEKVCHFLRDRDAVGRVAVFVERLEQHRDIDRLVHPVFGVVPEVRKSALRLPGPRSCHRLHAGEVEWGEHCLAGAEKVEPLDTGVSERTDRRELRGAAHVTAPGSATLPNP